MTPLSSHDLAVLLAVLTHQRITEYQPSEEREDNELIISAKRVKADPQAELRVCGVTIRLSDTQPLNEIRFVRQGREPLIFDFESDAP